MLYFNQATYFKLCQSGIDYVNALIYMIIFKMDDYDNSERVDQTHFRKELLMFKPKNQ